MGYNDYTWEYLSTASPWHFLCCQNFTAKEESISGQYGFDFVLCLNTTTHAVRLLLSTRSRLSDQVVHEKAFHWSARTDKYAVGLHPPISLYGQYCANVSKVKSGYTCCMLTL